MNEEVAEVLTTAEADGVESIAEVLMEQISWTRTERSV